MIILTLEAFDVMLEVRRRGRRNSSRWCGSSTSFKICRPPWPCQSAADWWRRCLVGAAPSAGRRWWCCWCWWSWLSPSPLWSAAAAAAVVVVPPVTCDRDRIARTTAQNNTRPQTQHDIIVAEPARPDSRSTAVYVVSGTLRVPLCARPVAAGVRMSAVAAARRRRRRRRRAPFSPSRCDQRLRRRWDWQRNRAYTPRRSIDIVHYARTLCIPRARTRRQSYHSVYIRTYTM